MVKTKLVFVFLFAALCLIPSSAVLPRQEGPAAGMALAGQSSLQPSDLQTVTLWNNLPLNFVENRGQLDNRVKYHAKIRNGQAYFTGQEVVYHFLLGEEDRNTRPEKPFAIEGREETIRVSFLGANGQARPKGQGKQEAAFNYYRGRDPRAWVTGAPSYAKVVYRDLYPGIDLVVSGREGRMKNEYVVHAGADATALRLRYEGARGLRVNSRGQLEIQTSTGMLIEDVPVSYVFKAGKRAEVATAYEIADDQTVHFRLGEYARDAELVIDPLAYSTFLGGSSSDYGYALAVNGTGNAFVTGFTASSDFPTTTGAFDTSYGSSGDAFITKLNSSGTALVYSTYLGGTSSDYGYGIALDGLGNAFVTGYTGSGDFPATTGAYDTTFNGSSDVFVSKLDSNGGVLLFSTFLGGTGDDDAFGIVADGSGNAFVTGFTSSSNFPATTGAYDTSFNGSLDAFVTKLNSSGSALLYSTYLGGTDSDSGLGIALDGMGDVHLTGNTDSSDFPVTTGAYDTSFNGWTDVFVAKLDSSGSALVYSTFLGGTLNDSSSAISLDGSNKAHVTGFTNSDDFPVTLGAYDSTYNGGYDIFIAKLNPAGNVLQYATFLGGTDDEKANGIAVDAAKDIYLAGFTCSPDFPTTSGAFATSHNGAADSFLTKVAFAGNALLYSTFLGGTGSDCSYGLAVDASLCPYTAGYTTSVDFPTTSGAFDTSLDIVDAFVVKFPAAIPDIRQPIAAIDFGNVFIGSPADKTTTIYNDGGAALNVNSVTWTSGSADFNYVGPPVPFVIAAGGSQDVTVRFAPASEGAKAAVFTVNSDDSDEPNVTFDVTGTGVVAPDIRQPVSAIGFGNVNVGGTSDQTTAIYNDGSGTLTVNTVTWSSGSTEFTYLSPTVPFSILAGGSQNVTVRFAPTSAGAKSAVFNINSDDPDEADITFDVSGTGIVIPDIRQPISAIGFGNVNVGSTSDQTTAIYNDGNGTLTINSVTWTSGSTEFSYVGPSVPFTITGGGSQNVTVRFAPTSGGAKTAVFNVNSDDPDESDVTFDVSGTGVVITETVSTPNTPSGPTSGSVGTSYAYSTGGSTSNLGHDVQYLIDWGDGTDSGWLPVGTTSAEKSWSSASTYNVTAKARCASHTTVESSASSSLSVVISVAGYDNSPSNYQIIPECIWAPATGGGTWVSEVQLTDITGGSVVSVYFSYGGGNRRGPFTLWTSPGADRNVKYTNLLSSIDDLDAEAFTYYGRVGAVEFSTQDASHKIHVVARTLNGDYSKTFPGLNLTDSNTGDTSRRMILQNFVNNATYRSSCGFFNPTADSVTVELKLIDTGGSQIGSTVTRTLVGHDFQSFSPFNQAGVPYPSYSHNNVVLWVTPTSGSGKVMIYGATAHNTSNDPAAHIGVQYQGSYVNSPSNCQVIPECLWAVATGGGTWVSEVQITDITGGSVISVYFDYGGGNRRGPFTLWTSPGADRNVKYTNLLSSIDDLDSEAFTYYGRVGTVEFSTQDASHKVQVVARTLNGDYSKTFPGLNLTDSNTADTARRLILQNFVNNASYRSSCGFFNPTGDSVTLELKLIDANGSQIGSTITRTLVGYDFQSFSPFNQAGVPYPTYAYDNVVLWITPTSGSGKVMIYGATANNTSNDPAAHIGVQYQ